MYWYSWYDAVGIFVQAIARLAYRGAAVNGTSLQTEVRTMSYTGVSGPFVVSSHGIKKISGLKFSESSLCVDLS